MGMRSSEVQELQEFRKAGERVGPGAMPSPELLQLLNF